LAEAVRFGGDELEVGGSLFNDFLEQVFTVLKSLFEGFLEPMLCGARVFVGAAAFEVALGKRALCLAEILLCGFLIPGEGLLVVLLGPSAVCVTACEVELGGGVPLFGGFDPQAHGFFAALFDSLAIVV